MQKKVLIEVSGVQKYTEGHEDQQDLVTIGNLYERSGNYYVIYQESKVTGMEGVTTTLKVESSRVALNRTGTVKLKQEFELNVLHHSSYISPFGTFRLSVYTTEFESDLTALGGRISLKYDLFIDDDLVSKNELRIIIKEEPPR